MAVKTAVRAYRAAPLIGINLLTQDNQTWVDNQGNTLPLSQHQETPSNAPPVDRQPSHSLQLFVYDPTLYFFSMSHRD
ncbi:MAG: hypothetical protein RLZZ09_1222 [Pseudomonadota bacterium]|jgi:hypothetical protein